MRKKYFLLSEPEELDALMVASKSPVLVGLPEILPVLSTDSPGGKELRKPQTSQVP